LEHLSPVEVRDLIKKMSISCEVDASDNNSLIVHVPITRSDIMHECDLIEDMAIAYGYNNLHTQVPHTHGGASEQPLNHLTDLLRVSIANAGWTEAYNWALISQKENFDFLRHVPLSEALVNPQEYSPNLRPARLGNAKTKEFEIVRTTLLAGVLKCLASNKQLPLPIKIFEIGDVVAMDPSMEVGARNLRRICAIHAGQTGEFAKLHGLLDQVMFQLKCEPSHVKADNPNSKNRAWMLSPSQDPGFFPGRQAHIVVEGVSIGVIGELHPEVVSSKGFDINMAVSAFEMNMEPFLEWL
jgi:phenylalanyl-tRNA synthetase beta chain